MLRQRYFQSILDATLSDHKTFHRLVNRQRKASPGQQALNLRSDGQLVTDPQRVLELWQDHYKALGTPKEDPNFDNDHLRMVTADVQVIEAACQRDTSLTASGHNQTCLSGSAQA